MCICIISNFDNYFFFYSGKLVCSYIDNERIIFKPGMRFALSVLRLCVAELPKTCFLQVNSQQNRCIHACPGRKIIKNKIGTFHLVSFQRIPKTGNHAD